MKKISTLWIALCTVMATTVLSSCDDDMSRAMTLSSEWRGDFGMFYEYEYYGRIYTFNSYDTRLVFYPDYDYATHGYGKQVDYYDQGPYVYQYYYFNWYIDRGDLVLDYPYDPNLNTVIHDYHMSSSTFYGYFGNSNNKFYLRKTADYYDWGGFTGNYYYGPRDYWYWGYRNYVKRQPAPADSLSPIAPLPSDSTAAPQGHIVRRGNRIGGMQKAVTAKA